MAICQTKGSRPKVPASTIDADAALCCACDSDPVKPTSSTTLLNHSLNKMLTALKVLPAVALLGVIGAGLASADSKNDQAEGGRQGNSVGIDSVINDPNGQTDAWKLLEQGFVIECSARFESGCQLFLKAE